MRPYIEILIDLVDGNITREAARLELAVGGRNIDGTVFDSSQIDLLLDEATARVDKWRKGAEEREETRAITERDYLEQEEGMQGVFLRDVESRLTPTSSSLMRDALERRYGQLREVFRLKGGLGELEDIGGQRQTFADWLPQATTSPGAELRRLLQGAASVLKKGFTGTVAAPGDFTGTAGIPAGETEESIWLGSRAGGLYSDLYGDPDKQFNLAIQSIITDIPLHQRRAFIANARDAFQREISLNPGKQWLPGFAFTGQFGPKRGAGAGLMPLPEQGLDPVVQRAWG